MISKNLCELEKADLIITNRESSTYISLAKSLEAYFWRDEDKSTDYRGLAHGLYTSLCAVSAMRISNGEKTIDISKYSHLSESAGTSTYDFGRIAFELSGVGYGYVSEFASRLKYHLSYPHYNLIRGIITTNAGQFKDLNCKLKSDPDHFETIIKDAGALDTVLLAEYLTKSGVFNFI
ncbi:hypothetical protein M1316_01830 [Candidatus Parvarchaeota archaeon]|nr:hypothetical protein [Candidatus Parvarchaeota archaeon]